MIRSTCALVLIVAGALALTGCPKKDETSGSSSGTAAATDAPPASGAPSATAADTASAAPPADTSSAATSASAPPPDAPPPAVAAPGGPVRGIEDCCAALASASVMSRSHSKRASSNKAAEICPGIAAQVRAGRASRAMALTQLRSAFAAYGGQVPGPCR
jgi:hypothetical protein